MNTKSNNRFQQQMRVFDKITIVLGEKISIDTLSYFFLLHLISGIKQSEGTGFTAEDFMKLLHEKNYLCYIDNSKRLLNQFISNEKSTLIGKTRIKWFLRLLRIGCEKEAGIIMGLK